MRYATVKPLPQRRVEIYLAQIALTVAHSVGNSDLTLADFLLDFAGKAPKMTAEAGAHAFATIAGGHGVRVLGKKTTKKKGA